MKFYIWGFLKKYVEKIQVSLKSPRIKDALHEAQYTLFTITRSFLLTMRNVSDQIIEKIKKHILCSVTIFFFEIRAGNEIMWENIVQPYTPQMTIWQMRTVCWILKATNTHTSFFSNATMVALTLLLVTSYIHCLFCFKFLDFSAVVRSQSVLN